MNYEELLNNLKSVQSKEQQIEALFQFLLESLEYDYLYLEMSRLKKCANENSLEFSDLYDEELVDEILNKFSKYLTIPNYVVEFFKNKEFEKLRPGFITDSPIFENEIIKKGVCLNFSNFIKKVCDELEINCEIQKGATPFAHAWNKIQINNQWLNFDVTYAIYSRDKYNGWGERSKPQDWFGITDEELLKLHPERTIDVETKQI